MQNMFKKIKKKTQNQLKEKLGKFTFTLIEKWIGQLSSNNYEEFKDDSDLQYFKG